MQWGSNSTEIFFFPNILCMQYSMLYLYLLSFFSESNLKRTFQINFVIYLTLTQLCFSGAKHKIFQIQVKSFSSYTHKLSECGNVISVTLTTAGLLVPDRLLWIFQKTFTQNGVKNIKHLVNRSFADPERCHKE